MRRRKGQSILEYVIVLTAIVAAIAVAASTLIQPAMDQSLTDSMDVIQGATDRMPK